MRLSLKDFMTILKLPRLWCNITASPKCINISFLLLKMSGVQPRLPIDLSLILFRTPTEALNFALQRAQQFPPRRGRLYEENKQLCKGHHSNLPWVNLRPAHFFVDKITFTQLSRINQILVITHSVQSFKYQLFLPHQMSLRSSCVPTFRSSSIRVLQAKTSKTTSSPTSKIR